MSLVVMGDIKVVEVVVGKGVGMDAGMDVVMDAGNTVDVEESIDHFSHFYQLELH